MVRRPDHPRRDASGRAADPADRDGAEPYGRVQHGVDVGASEAGGEQAGGEPVSGAGGVHDPGRHSRHRADLVTRAQTAPSRAELHHDLGHRPGQRQRDRRQQAVHSEQSVRASARLASSRPAPRTQLRNWAGPARRKGSTEATSTLADNPREHQVFKIARQAWIRHLPRNNRICPLSSPRRWNEPGGRPSSSTADYPPTSSLFSSGSPLNCSAFRRACSPVTTLSGWPANTSTTADCGHDPPPGSAPAGAGRCRPGDQSRRVHRA